ncbi:MAG: hypothetical protein LQ343_003571 [Gyalolechia ehrenbergii]|nr:MAG: hypothetical protein LQ343_003571 [Gyalolechia ehrenbergii]
MILSKPAIRHPNLSPPSILRRRYRSSVTRPLTSILIANRGEIALRVGRTAAEYGIRCTTMYTDPDAKALHALSSPFAVNLGDPSAYLDGERIIKAAKENGCLGIHPGRSKEIMTEAGVPCIPGYHGQNQDPVYLKHEAEKIGFPVLIKAVKGGGGKGMRIAMTAEDFDSQLASAKSEARSSCGDEVMLVEKYITTPRHIEVQIFADKHGNCVALGERDCSIQRRHQKILEETPAPNLDETVRQDIWGKARAAALAVGYEGAGTVEFIFDNETGEFFFMEMNTRLQVEHPVTEMVTGEDLVRWQIIIAEGGRLPLTQQEVESRIAERGHAIEARIYAENPAMDFIPDSGRLQHLRLPNITDSVRVDAGFIAGDEVSSHYDPMIAKLIVLGPDRETAIRKLNTALNEYEIAGPITNVEFLKRVCKIPAFVAGEVETGFIRKWHADLFQNVEIKPEVFAQAALGAYLAEALERQGRATLFSGAKSGFSSISYKRSFQFAPIQGEGSRDTASTTVELEQTGNNLFTISANGNIFASVASRFDPGNRTITSFFPHTRLETRFIRDEGSLTLFQQGQQYRLQCLTPSWLEKALGIKDTAHSVLAPMPCKILRVEVEQGQKVKKEQVLVVIESMKMETSIRSPQDGVISKIVHQQGELCKAGTALVEFEDLTGAVEK